MDNLLTTVTYHYVRDPEKTPFKNFKTLRVEEFKGQIDFLSRFYQFINVSQLTAFLNSPKKFPLPKKAVLLTFDDGLVDHYANVLPILKKRKIRGLFFVPAAPIKTGTILDVHKIHLILNFVRKPQILVREIDSWIKNSKKDYSLKELKEYKKTWFKNGLYDPAEIMYVKGMLQSGLPESLRKKLINRFFKQHVSLKENDVALEIYASENQLREMTDEGMNIGFHGFSHQRMNFLSRREQIEEIKKSLDFMKSVGAPVKDWICSYPFGSYNKETVKLVRNFGARAGFSTKLGIASLFRDNNMALPRLDTNELPKRKKEKLAYWTKQILS